MNTGVSAVGARHVSERADDTAHVRSTASVPACVHVNAK